MKKSWKTKVTALMFSVSAIGVGAIAVSCGVYGPPNVAEIDRPADCTALTTAAAGTVTETAAAAIVDTEPADFSDITEEELLHLSDDDFIALAKQHAARKEDTVYRTFRPENGTAFCSVAAHSAADRAEADSIAEQFYQSCQKEYHTDGYPQFAEEKAGFWWYYDFGPHLGNLLVTDKAFFDAETITLHAAVNEENMLRLASLNNFASNGGFGAFAHDTGDALECTIYEASVSEGDYGMSDQAVLTAHTFSAEKATGTLKDFWCDGANVLRKLEIPDSYHDYPDES